MVLLAVFFALSIITSFLCSIWEAVLLSVTPSYIRLKEQEGSRAGKLLVEQKKDIDKPLSAILTLNTIAHTVGAIGVGVQAGKVFGHTNLSLFGLEISSESIIATVMTLAVLFLSEIIPKTIGANNWQSLAPITARSLNVLMILLKPFVWLSNQLTRLMKKDKEKSVLSKRDFAAMAEVVSESGEIEEGDYQLIKNVLRYDELTAKDVMTPRTVMVMAEEKTTLQEFHQSQAAKSFSRIPLYSVNRDNITGMVLKNELLANIIAGKGEESLESIRRSIQTVPANTALRKIFTILNEKRAHMAVVVDQYGSVLGIVTLEDVIETLFGLEIMDETDSVTDLQKFARQKWEARAKKYGLIE